MVPLQKWFWKKRTKMAISSLFSSEYFADDRHHEMNDISLPSFDEFNAAQKFYTHVQLLNSTGFDLIVWDHYEDMSEQHW